MPLVTGRYEATAGAAAGAAGGAAALGTVFGSAVWPNEAAGGSSNIAISNAPREPGEERFDFCIRI
jgi:hypothetical protein